MTDAPSPGPTRSTSVILLAVGAVIMLAGLLFGYDQGVISGALDGIQKQFSVGTLLLEVITSWVTLGAMVGALVAGALADRLGRRLTIVTAAVLFVAGALVESLAPGSYVLVAGRLLVGFGVGVASVAAPLYAAELAPSRVRGRMVSLYQLAITIGIFVAYFADYLLINGDQWRVMLGISAVPGVLLVLAILPLPDSPRWYVSRDRHDEARSTLQRVEPGVNIDQELTDIEDLNAAEAAGSWREVFALRWRRPLVIGVMLAVLQQFTGINAIIYYADKIFAAAGFGSPASQSLATLWAIGAVNVVSTFVAVAWVDRFGRKPLLLIGSVGMGTSLIVVGCMFEVMGTGAHPSHHHHHHRRGDDGRPHRVHRLFCLLARSRGVDHHQRDLSLPHPGSSGGRGHGGQLVRSLAGGPVLSFLGGSDHRGRDVLALRRLLCSDFRLRPPRRARDEGQDVGGSRDPLGGRGIRRAGRASFCGPHSRGRLRSHVAGETGQRLSRSLAIWVTWISSVPA